MWKTLVLSVAGLLLLQGESQAWPDKNEAEDLFCRMEAKLSKAKTIEFQFESTFQSCPGGILNGSVAFGEDKKSRIEMEDRHRGNKTIFICDGKKLASGPRAWSRGEGELPTGVPHEKWTLS